MKKLIILLHSMRSHKTGEYQIMLDSNVNIILHQLSKMTRDDQIDITMPRNHNKMYMKQFTDIVNTFHCTVNKKFIDYGANVGETRDIINSRLDSIEFSEYDEVESHFCTVEPKIGNTNYVIFASAVPGQKRPHSERHFITLLNRLEAGYPVTLSCENQRSYIPDILQISTNIKTKFFNPELADYMSCEYYCPMLKKALDDLIPKDSLFFPFRVSDTCYRADLVSRLGGTVIITDPNDTADGVFSNYIDISTLHECKKTLYTTMLILMKVRKDIRIPLYEDITKNYHIGIVEMLYYCPDSIDFLYGKVNIHNLIKSYIL